MSEREFHQDTAKKRERYKNDPAYRDLVKARAREYAARPEVKAHKAEYNRLWRAKQPPGFDRDRLAERSKNPEFVSKERLRGRIKNRVRYATAGPLESTVEDYLVEQVEKAGGFCPKLTTPGRLGAPDRIAFLPGGVVIFIELKREVTGRVEGPQHRYHKTLRELGQKVYVPRTKGEIDAIPELRKALARGII